LQKQFNIVCWGDNKERFNREQIEFIYQDILLAEIANTTGMSSLTYPANHLQWNILGLKASQEPTTERV